MIILEGPDNAGKTTLAKSLSLALEIPIHHSGGPPKDKSEILHRQANINTLLFNRKVLILDRIPVISDATYGQVLRGSSHFDDTQQPAEVRRNLWLPIIYCRPPTSHLLNLDARLEEIKAYKPPEHVAAVKANAAAIVTRYDMVMGLWPHWNYDFTGTCGLTEDQLIPLLKVEIAKALW